MLARLNPEFPDLTPSKLRFLEEQQLVRPSRTESGYRKFSPADLERLRFVLSMQRDYYLPLKVIRALPRRLDAGREPVLPGATTRHGTVDARAERRLARDELIREAGANAMLLEDAVSASLIVAADHYGEDALAVLRALVELRAVGIEPRHLRGVPGRGRARSGAHRERHRSVAAGAMPPQGARRRRAGSRDRRSARDRALEPSFALTRSSRLAR